MDKKIVKAEILFSRQCPLHCSYCAMKNSKQNTRSIDQWKRGMVELKRLGCKLVAFYGAEPLMEFDKLKHVVWYCEDDIVMDTTIITSGAVPDFEHKLLELYEYGAKSLSMSFDPSPSDISTKNKSDNALESLIRFRELKGIRDVAAIATLNAHNFMEFPNMVRRMTRRGIWSFFDFIHTDRGQVGTKCSNVPQEMMLTKEHYPAIKDMLREVLFLKGRGFLCHTSQYFVDVMNERMDTGNLYSWTCANQSPSWVTIDCDGMVYPCDDFTGTHTPTDMLDIYNKWDVFSSACTLAVQQADCRCAWNTHIDAHGIMNETVQLSDYVHGKYVVS